jgi:hypothetical protein
MTYTASFILIFSFNLYIYNVLEILNYFSGVTLIAFSITFFEINP